MCDCLPKKPLNGFFEKHSIEKRPRETTSKISRRIFWIKNFEKLRKWIKIEKKGSKMNRELIVVGPNMDRKWIESGSKSIEISKFYFFFYVHDV